MTNDDSQTSLDNIDPKGNAKITPSFFANGPVTFEPPSFTFECFTSGTHIATPAGQRLVQDLKPGDLVLTARGEATAIAWAGKRTLDCSRHPNPAAVSPVLIEPGAFADAVPSRPLRLSPDHAVLIEDVLIPIKHLINGTTIRQVPADVVTYHHIELERHDVLLAEGLAAESYLDVGQRAVFSGGATVVAYPDFGAQRWEAEGCAPLMVAGAAVDRARAHLNTRAAAAAAATQQHVQRTA